MIRSEDTSSSFKQCIVHCLKDDDVSSDLIKLEGHIDLSPTWFIFPICTTSLYYDDDDDGDDDDGDDYDGYDDEDDEDIPGPSALAGVTET